VVEDLIDDSRTDDEDFLESAVEDLIEVSLVEET